MEEIWSRIPQFEDLYEVSNLGRIRSLDHFVMQNNAYVVFERLYKGRVMAARIPHNKYPYLHLSKNGKRKTVKIHRLVADAFVPNPERKPEVNHIDGIKINNSFSNLEWATSKENKHHAKVNNLAPKNPFGIDAYACKGYVEVLDKDNNRVKVLAGKEEILKFGLTPSGVSEALKNKNKFYKGYRFRRIASQ